MGQKSVFSTIFCKFCLFVALCAFAAICLKPSKNCGFVALRAFQRCAIVGAQNDKKMFKKPTKNLSKTTSEPFQNRCQKCVVFRHRFFRVSASILKPLGPPTWSQVGHFGLKQLGAVLLLSLLKLSVF